jgi:hypothetical protein
MRDKPTKRVPFLFFLLVVLFGLDAAARPQQASSEWTGTWMATTGGQQYFRGTWSGEVSGADRNAARGAWTLLGDAGDVVMEGTWSARKTREGWQGTWTARVSKGGSLAGSWSADLAGFAGKTMEEMLNRTNEKQVAGSWQSGRYQGYWYLDGSRAKAKKK